MKTVAFLFGICIATFGAVSMLAPSAAVWAGGLFVTPGSFYALAAVRITFGFILLSVAADSRLPKALRVLGWVILLLGLTTAVLALVGFAPVRDSIQSWLQRGSAVIRLTAVFIVALGSFIAYACAPLRRAPART